MTYTVVSFHAHPDDEALLTAGTLARAAAAGHRVVLVVATAGEAGLAGAAYGTGQQLAARRLGELRAAAAILGVAEVLCLGYPDSGSTERAAPRFCDVPVAEAAQLLADILRREGADVLTTYDVAGGYGHPDHIAVHRVGAAAAELAGTPVVLEATVRRTSLLRVLRLISWLPGLPAGFSAHGLRHSYASDDELTHRIPVQSFLVQKRAAMRAHVSQATADEGTRTLAVLTRLPGPLFTLAMRSEWFIEQGRTPQRRLLGDIFATLR